MHLFYKPKYYPRYINPTQSFIILAETSILPKKLYYGQYNMVQFYILSNTFKKNTGISLMTDMVYITSMASIDFLDRNTVESKSLSL